MKKQFTELIRVCCALVFLFSLTATAQAQYCASSASSTAFEHIGNVQYQGFSNVTGNGTYTDYTGLGSVGTISPGIEETISVTVNGAFASDDIWIYIDWNGDAQFTSEDQVGILLNTGSGTQTFDIPITVPPGATPGETRMRVQMFEDFNDTDPGNPCASLTFGDVEDYLINIVGGECTPPIFTYDVVNDCEAETYTVEATLTDFSGNSFITVVLTRSDAVPVDPVTLPFVLVGQTVDIIQNVPFGVTVVASIQGANPLCNQTRNFAQELCPVVNDICAEALPLPCNGSYFGTTEGATVDTETCRAFFAGSAGVWFEYTPTVETIVTLETCNDGTNFDTDLNVFTGTCEELTCFPGFSGDGYVDGNFACSFASFAAQGTFTAQAGETYYILLNAFGTTTFGEYTLTVTCEELLCSSPDLDLAVVDVDGNALGECTPFGESYYVEVGFTGGDGNDNYSVSLNGGAAVEIAADGSAILGPVNPGTTANVVATGVEDDNCGTSGSILQPVCPPANDLCVDAEIAECGGNYAGTTVGSTNDPAQLYCGTSAPAATNGGVWYSFTPANNTSADIDLSGSLYDTKLFVYSGECGALVCEGGDDDGGDGLDSRLVIQLEGGTTYYIYVSGFGTSRGEYVMNITCTDILCEFPDVTATAVDADGVAIDGCVPAGTQFFVDVDLTGAAGNDSYNVAATANFSTQNQSVPADGSATFGPYLAGTNVTIAVTGEQDPLCGGNASATAVVCPPVNDACVDALPLACNSSIFGNTLGATAELPRCAPGAGFGDVGPSVWYTVSFDEETVVTLNTCTPNTNFDTDLTVFEGDNCDNLVCFTGYSGDGWADSGADGTLCNNGPLFAAFGTFTAAPGATYYIKVSGFGTTSQGTFELEVSCQNLACSPEVAATAVADANGGEIVDCVPQEGEYYVSVSLTGGSGLFDVIVNGDVLGTVAGGGTTIVGPVAALATANVTVVGQDDITCSGSASTSVSDICPPSNDEACGAIALVVDGPASGPFNNADATTSPGEPSPSGGGCIDNWCDGGTVSNSLWFVVEVPEGVERISINACNAGTNFDTQLAAYSAGDCNDYSTFELLGANDDAADGCTAGNIFSSNLELCVEPGSTIYVQMDGFGSFGAASGNVVLNVASIDAAVCACVPPVVDPEFILAQSFTECSDPENPGYTVTLYAPEDLGTNVDGLSFTYSYPGQPATTVLVVDSFEVPGVIGLGELFNITIDYSDPACIGSGGIFPLSGAITQLEGACAPDCEGVAGGPAQPGTACTTDGGDAGIWDANCVCQATPENDLACNAIALECGETVSGSTVSAGLDEDCGGATGGAGVWYTYTATSSGTITLETCLDGTDYDSDLSVLTGPSCDDLTCFSGFSGDGYNDGNFSCAFAAFATQGTFDVEPGVTYYILIHGWSGNGNFTLSLTCDLDDEASLAGTVNWNSNCGSRDADVLFYEAGTTNLVASYDVTVNADGTFNIPAVATGTFDVFVNINGYLQKGFADVNVALGVNNLAVGAVVNGDINNSNTINIVDVSLLNAAFNSATGAPNFNPLADLNCSGNVNIVDVSLLNAGFGQIGQVAPL